MLCLLKLKLKDRNMYVMSDGLICMKTFHLYFSWGFFGFGFFLMDESLLGKSVSASHLNFLQ